MLTVEVNDKEQRVEVYADAEGLETLQRTLDILRQRGGHDHLMTPAWAGTELTDVPQGDHTRIFQHLLLVFRPTSAKES